MDEAIAMATAFCARENRQPGIYFYGQVGCGKTLIVSKMLYLMASLRDRELSACWPYVSYGSNDAADVGLLTSVPSLLAKIRAGFSDREAASDQIVSDVRNSGFLVLDDIGAEKPSEWVRDVLFQIVDFRYGRQLPTAFTSNCSLRELAERLGERIADRILEMCKGRIVEIECGSYRG